MFDLYQQIWTFAKEHPGLMLLFVAHQGWGAARPHLTFKRAGQLYSRWIDFRLHVRKHRRRLEEPQAVLQNKRPEAVNTSKGIVVLKAS